MGCFQSVDDYKNALSIVTYKNNGIFKKINACRKNTSDRIYGFFKNDIIKIIYFMNGCSKFFLEDGTIEEIRLVNGVSSKELDDVINSFDYCITRQVLGLYIWVKRGMKRLYSISAA